MSWPSQEELALEKVEKTLTRLKQLYYDEAHSLLANKWKDKFYSSIPQTVKNREGKPYSHLALIVQLFRDF